MSFSTAFTVDRTPDEVFAAINDVRSWWTGEIAGGTGELGSEFTYRHGDQHRSTQRITELVSGKRVAWRIVDAYLDFAADKAEWTGTEITFDIVAEDGGTEVRFTHVGLAPEYECFEACSTAWGYYVNTSLPNRIVNGRDAR
jgi:hypothetical protein